MKFFFSYLKDNLKWIAIVLFSEVVMTAVMWLNGNPWNEIGYGAVMVFALLGMILGYDGYRQWRKYCDLCRLEHSIYLTLQGLTDDGSIMEQEYQKLLHILFTENASRQNDAQGRQKDMREYYGMWVHQIKTPIFALRLLLQEKNESGENTEELEELFRIEQYVEMALQYMRLDSETTDFVIRKIELDDVLRDAIHKYAQLFIHKKISLDYQAVHAVVLTDEKWMGFVVEQILSNAIKYTARGKVTIVVEQQEEWTNLCITDTGIGIQAEDLPRICEKGFTGYNGHADKHSTGIGLYLCSCILKKLGHRFDITSEERVGTCVKIGFCKKRK